MKSSGAVRTVVVQGLPGGRNERRETTRRCLISLPDVFDNVDADNINK